MFRRSFLLVLLAAAVGVPYLLSSSTGLRQIIARPFTTSSEQLVAKAETAAKEQPPATLSGLATPADQAAKQPLEQVFRFDVTTAWVLGQWPRVSTALASLDQLGYRVPLVTGSAESDLAGSLTYYFNPNQQVERITFTGATGDARRLVALLATRHGFQRKIVNDPGLYLYQVEERGKVISHLAIKPQPVVRGDNPHARFAVELVMQRPEKRG